MQLRWSIGFQTFSLIRLLLIPPFLRNSSLSHLNILLLCLALSFSPFRTFLSYQLDSPSFPSQVAGCLRPFLIVWHRLSAALELVWRAVPQMTMTDSCLVAVFVGQLELPMLALVLVFAMEATRGSGLLAY